MSERARILLVDDRPENLLALEAILTSLDQVLVRANSGEEALRELLKGDFAMILLDAQMPGMDGFETAARIKRRSRTRDVPIIFLTAADRESRNSYRGYQAGGADYLSKPFDPWILRAKVKVFVDLWAAGRRLATQATFLRGQLEDEGVGAGVLRELENRIADLARTVAQLEATAETGELPDIVNVAHRIANEVDGLQRSLTALDAGDTAAAVRRGGSG